MPTQEKGFHDYPLEERFSQAIKIARSIPQDRIRVQKVEGKVKEMWGFVWLSGLPFCFRAWPDPSGRKLEFLQNGPLSEKREAHWWVHAPYSPIDFKAAIFTKPIGENDIEYVLEGLGINSEGSTRELFTHSLLQQGQRYEEFNEQYERDSFLRGAFDAAATLACDEKMQEVNSS